MTTTPTQAARVSGTDIDRAMLQSMATSFRSGMDFSFNRHDMAELLDRLAAIQPDPETDDLPSDGTCKQCGCAPVNPAGLCVCCVEESTTPSSAGTVSVEAAARVLLDACPNPIFDALKPALMGEIRETVRQTDEYGDEISVDRQVPWDTMKNVIRVALRALAGGRG